MLVIGFVATLTPIRVMSMTFIMDCLAYVHMKNVRNEMLSIRPPSEGLEDCPQTILEPEKANCRVARAKNIVEETGVRVEEAATLNPRCNSLPAHAFYALTRAM